MFRTILMKELKDVLRDRRSITLLILIPILLMSGLTFFYDRLLSDTDSNDYVIGIDADVDNHLLQELEVLLPEVKIEQEENLSEQIEDKQVHAGLRIDANWQEKMESLTPVAVEILYDPSSQESSAAYIMLASVFSEWESLIVENRLIAANIDAELTNVFQVQETAIKDEDHALASFLLTVLIPVLIPIAIANGSYPSATELFAGEKEKQTIEALLITPVKPCKVLLAKWTTIALLGIFTGLFCLLIFAIELQFTANLKMGFAGIEHPWGFVGMSMVLITLFAVFISAVEMIFSMLANSVKEAGYYLTPLFGLLVLPLLFMFFMSESLITWLYAIPVLNLFLFVRDTFSEQITLGAFGLAASSYVLMIMLLFLIANKMFHQHRLMLGK